MRLVAMMFTINDIIYQFQMEQEMLASVHPRETAKEKYKYSAVLKYQLCNYDIYLGLN